MSAESLEILTEGLKQSDARARLETALALRRLGARATAAEEALAEVAKNDAHPLVRDMAIGALKAIGGERQIAEHHASAKAGPKRAALPRFSRTQSRTVRCRWACCPVQFRRVQWQEELPWSRRTSHVVRAGDLQSGGGRGQSPDR